jgi:hypothetical protein
MLISNRKHSRTPQSPLLLNNDGMDDAPYDGDAPRYQYSYFTSLAPLTLPLGPVPRKLPSSVCNMSPLDLTMLICMIAEPSPRQGHRGVVADGDLSSSPSPPPHHYDMAAAALTGDASVDTSGDRRLPLPLRDAQRRVYAIPPRGDDATAIRPRVANPSPPPPSSSSPSSSMVPPSAYYGGNTNNGVPFTPRVPVPPFATTAVAGATSSSPVSSSSGGSGWSPKSGSMSARRAVRSPRTPGGGGGAASPRSARGIRQPWDDRHHVEQ